MKPLLTGLTAIWIWLWILNFPAGALPPGESRSKKTVILLPDGEKVDALVADTPASRTTGLMGRPRLDIGEGMLFFFESSESHMIWMKNMAIPIDILWLNDRKEIIDIVESAPPCKGDPCAIYGPALPSRYVLELKDGAAKNFHLKKGMNLKF